MTGSIYILLALRYRGVAYQFPLRLSSQGCHVSSSESFPCMTRVAPHCTATPAWSCKSEKQRLVVEFTAFTYGNYAFGDPSKSDAIDVRRISCD